MKNYISIKELCEKLWQFEEKMELLEVEIQGIRIWEVIRFSIFNELSMKLSGYSLAHTKKSSLSSKIIDVFHLLKNSILRNPFSGEYNLNFIVYDHERKISVDGNIIDIYTNYFIESHDEKDFDVIEWPYLWKHYTNSLIKNRKYIDHELLTVFIKRKLSPISITNREKDIIKNIQNQFDKQFKDININLTKIIENSITHFIHRFNYHKKLFQKRKPKRVYVVVSYGKIPIIAAAKELGIEVIEFQHGVITDYHFAYNFSNPYKKLRYFPDELWTFGEYWGKTKGFPIQSKIQVYGFPYLNFQLKKYKNILKKKNQVLFLSQGTIGKELSKYAKKLAELMPGYNIIYKLHPGEYDRWKNEYPDLVEATNLKNFIVVDNNENNLYSYFSESEYQVGVYSTAIFEGLTLNCKTILVDLPGIEYMIDLINQEIVAVARDLDELQYRIKNFQPKYFPKDYFFK